VALNGVDAADVLALAASVEQRSTHPIAQAILNHAAASGVVAVPADAVSALPGKGAEGRVAGARVLLGNHRLFEEQGLCSPAVHDRLADMEAKGRTAVLVASDGQTVGIIAVADRPRESGKDAIDLLRAQGVT